MADVTVRIEASGETPDEVREQITNLVARPLLTSANGSAPVSEEGPEDPDDLEDIARKKVERVFDRVGKKNANLLMTVAGYDDGYTTGQLATDLGISLVQLRSLAGNLGRTMAKINAELGDDPPLYRWNNATGKYEMPAEIRAAILELMQ